jgi:UDP-glucose 4-epimerase
MNILVTGGAGFIGSHVCVELLELGYKIIVIDNLSNSQINALYNVSKIVNIDLNIDEDIDAYFTFIKADIRDKEPLEKIFSVHEIDVVIHFAGLKSVIESVENPTDYYSNNVDGSTNLFHVMEKFNCKTIIFSSSSTVYGDSKEMPIIETSQLLPTNPYGKSKKIVEDLLKNLFNLDDSWHIAILRYFNPIGAHKSGLIGESPVDIPNNLLPYIMKVASGELKILNIFGNDYDTHDGTGVRDYIHVIDLAYGHIKALEVLVKKPQMITVNLGTGVGYSVLDIVRTFEKVTKQKIIYKISGRRDGDVAISYADTTFAKEVLGWEAIYNLEDMCHDLWEFKLKN